MENNHTDKIKMIYFMVFAVMMYYFLTEIVNLGIFVTFRHVFALLIFVSATLCFLYQPNIARGVTAIKGAFVYSAPLLVTLVASLFIWFVNQAETDVISRGLSGAFVYTNMLSFSLAAVSLLYVFGEKGVWYNLLAVITANILIIGTIILENGFGAYFSEFITLIRTFAAETGDIIVQAEVHELAFCLGAYLIYMILKPEKKPVYFILLALTLFCFLSAFKRIAIIAIAISVFFGAILRFVAKYKKETASALTTGFSLMLIVVLVGYIAIIKLGAFEFLEKIGIDTSGRADIYNSIDKYYDFSIEFLGNGIGFLTYQLNSGTSIGVALVHNDFLQYFIDLGFWGYLLWLTSMTFVRVKYFGAGGKIENTIISFSLILYLVIVSSTDNTMNYPLLTTVIGVIMIGHGFDDRVRENEDKMFGYISEVNEKSKGGLL